MLLPSVRRTDSPLNVGAVAPHQVHTYTPPYFFYEPQGLSVRHPDAYSASPWRHHNSKSQRMIQIMAEKIDLGIRESLTMNEEAQCAQIIKTGKVSPKAVAADGTLYSAAGD